MEPNIWGPPAWVFLHSITFQYPENPTDLDKQKYYTFFNSLKNVLPCPKCKEHYASNFLTTQINLESRTSLIEWLIDLHNEINRMNGKKILSYDEVYHIYNEIYDENQDSFIKNNYISIISFILLIFVCLYYYKNYYVKK